MKKLVILLLVLIEIGMVVYYETKPLKQDNLNHNEEAIAYMIEEESGEYKEIRDSLIPQEGYVLNKEKSGCIDADGNKILDSLDYDFDNKKVIYTTDLTSSCYLYFDIAK